MDKKVCALIFVAVALIVLCMCNREAFIPTPQAEYPDEPQEPEEAVEEVEEVVETTEVVEYPDEEGDLTGYDEPTFELSMKKIE